MLERRLREREASKTPEAPEIRPSDSRQPVASFAQERFWLLERLEPGNPAHHIAGVVRFEGPLNVDALEKVLELLTDRHPVIATAFRVEDGHPVPRPGARPRLVIEDRTDEHPPSSSERVEMHSASAREPFDLETGPVVRMRLVRWADGAQDLVLCVHHVVADGLSMRLLADELGVAYEAMQAGRDPELEPLPVTYEDYARWQRDWLTDEVLRPALTWWKRRLKDLPTLSLPFDHARGDDHRRRGARVARELSSDRLGELRTVAARVRVTPFVFALTAWKILLSRLTASTDIVVGTPWANRERPEVARLVGFFVNGLVVRTELDGAGTVEDAVKRVGVRVREAQERAHVPFERLVQAMDPDRDLDRHPLYQVMFNWVDFGGWSREFADGVTAAFEGTPVGALVDVSLYAHVERDGLRLELEYDDGLLDAVTAASWLRCLENVLTGMLADPSASIGSLRLGAEETEAWREGPALPEGGRRPLESVRHWAAEKPAAVAVTDELLWADVDDQGRRCLASEDRDTTYEQLLARVDDVAGVLERQGVRRGDRVALRLARDRELIVAALAVWSLDATWVPLDRDAPVVRNDRIIEDADVVGVLGPQGEWASRVADDRTGDPSIAYVIYTSGSTGDPKGVAVPHDALSNLLAAMAVTPGLSAEDSLLSVTAPTFDIALLEWFLPLTVGARVVMAHDRVKRDGRRLADRLKQCGATVMQGTPATWRSLIDAGWRDPRLRVWCGGEALPSDLAAQLRERGGEVWNLYGPTETCIWSCAWRVADGPVRIGRPIHETVVRVVDHAGHDVPVGVPGELWIGGAGVANGYWRQESSTADRFVDHGGVRYHKAGDIVRWHEDGTLECLGRTDDQVKVRGHRIAPGEVEVALRRLEGVRDAAVAVRPGPTGGHRLVGWVVTDGVTAGVGADEIVAGWTRVWDDAYASGDAADPEFDLAGWTSAIDGEPIPGSVMKEWLRGTVDRVRTVGARRVLEIGCGTGLVTARCAGETDRWVACDVSVAATERVRAIAEAHDWSHVDVLVGDARCVSEIAAGETFDAVIVNSVVQYLPDAAALETLIDGALDRLDDGGTLLLGDLRHGGDVGFHVWAEMLASKDDDAMDAFRARVRRREEADRELRVRPEIVGVLEQDGRVASARAVWRRGDGMRRPRARKRHRHDELTRFRFDILVERGEVRRPWVAEAVDGQNGLLLEAWIARQMLTGAQGRVEAFEQAVSERLAEFTEVDPGPLWAEGVEVGPLLGETVGLALLRRGEPRPIDDPGARFGSLEDFVRGGGVGAAAVDVGAVRAGLADVLPDWMIPERLVPVDTLPLTSSGKVDRKALVEPARETSLDRVEPRTDLERRVGDVWCACLGAEVGIHDDWFETGGHSLLATRLLAAIEEACGVDVPLRVLFEGPTIAELAAWIEGASAPVEPIPVGADPVPSFGQERLAFLDRLAPDDVSYLMPAAFRIVGEVDVDALRAALSDVAARHPSLRTSLPMVGGEVTVVVESDTVGALVVEEVPQDAVADLLAIEFARGFDLGSAPLWRARLLVHGETASTLLFVVHHAVADAWSVGVLTRDLGIAYESRRRGGGGSLRPVPIAPTDWAAWQRSEAERASDDLAWWRDLLSDPPSALELPTDRARPAEQDRRGEQRRWVIDRAGSATLSALASRGGASWFEVLAAGVALWLSKLAGTRDLIIGTSVAQRERAETADLVGFLVNTLPLRLEVGVGVSWDELLADVARRVRAARERGGVPFERIVEAVDPGRDLSRSPLFQVSLDLVELPATERFGDLDVERLDVLPPTSKFDLGLRFEVRGEELSCVVEWSSALFDGSTIERWWGWLWRLLEGAAATVDEPIEELRCESDEDRAAVDEWCRVRRATPPRDLTVHGMIAGAAERAPDHAAVVAGDEVCSFARLMEMAAAVASCLAARGVGPGDHVAVVAEPAVETLAVLLGVMQAGAAYVPVDPTYPAERRRFLIRDAECRCVIGVGEDAEVSPSEAVNFAGRASPPRVDTESPAYLLYTSGSTGQPKAVVVPHRAVVHYVAWARDAYGLSDASGINGPGGDAPDSVPSPGGAPLHTSLGFDLSVTSFLVPWAAGRPVHITPSLETALRRGGFDLVKLTPSHLAALPDDVASSAATRVLVVGGEALDAAVVRPWLDAGVRVVNEYGPTEATVGCVTHDVDLDDVGLVPIGRPIDRMSVRVVDDLDQDVPPGCVGELVVTGPGVAAGYHGRRRETLRAFEFEPTPSYRTGDRVRFDAEGRLRFLGRVDHQVKVRGVRIEPAEIEATLRDHPAVRDVAVVARETRAGVRLVAYVVGTVSVDELRSHCDGRLPNALVPTTILVLDALPLTANGKLDRSALPRATRANVSTAAVDPPRDAREAMLAQVVADVLELDTVGVHDDFFELGGDSITALDLVSRVREQGAMLEVRDVFADPTIARLAAAMTFGAVAVASRHPFVGRVPLSPIQRWWASLPLADRTRWHQGVVLDLAADVDRERLGLALGHVVAHHDLLRASWDGTSEFMEVPPSPLAVSPLPIADHAEIPPIDPDRPPLVAATWESGPSPRLRLYAHHLVVDAVSWRVIVDDLVRADADLERGAPVELPARTTAFAKAITRDPVAIGGGGYAEAGLEGDADVAEITFGEELSARLLGDANRALHSRPDDLVLASFARLVADAGGVALVDVEGHGRDEAVGDVSRTVGWFTAMRQVELPAIGSTVEIIRAIKDVRRSPRVARTKPARGLFNWLGHLRSEGGGVVRSVAPLYGLRGPDNPRTHAFECDAHVADGRVVVRVACPPGLVGGAAGWLAAFEDTTAALVAELLDHPRSLMPSDVPLADIEATVLDDITAVTPNVEDVFPLTPTQQGMALHALYDPESPAYVEQLVTVFSGGLDRAALRQAYQGIVAGYDLFRGAIRWRGVDRPHWVIAETIELPWFECELPQGEGTERDRLDRFAHADRARGFDLEAGPLVRCTLVDLNDDRAALLLTWHHTTLDGWSLPIILRKVYALYSAHERGEEPDPPRFDPFRDHVAWLESQDEADAREWFREMLAGYEEPVALDLRSGAAPSDGDGECELVVDVDECAELTAAARDLGITLGTLIRAAWGLMIGRLTGRDDVVFGVTVAGRPASLPDVAQRVGCFVNTLPMRIRADHIATRGDWLRALQRMFAEASRFEHAPLPMTQAEADVPRGTPLFDSLVVIENYPVQEALDELRRMAGSVTAWTRVWGVEGSAEAGALAIDDARGHERTSYALTLVAVPGDRLVLRVLWGAHAADHAGAESALRRLVAMMGGLVLEPDAPLVSLPTTMPWEESRVLVGLESGPPAAPFSEPVHEAILHELESHPARDAVIEDAGAVSARALCARIRGMGHWLLDQGVGPGDVVAVELPRGADWIAAMLGTWASGAIWMPIDPDLPPARKDQMLRIADAVLLVDGFKGITPSIDPLNVQRTADDPAYVLFTSGSTGEPKAVVVPHGAIATYTRSAADRFAIDDTDRVLHFAALGFDTGLEEVLTAMLSGAPVVARTDEMLAGVPAFLREIERLEISVLDLPTAFWHELVVGMDGLALPDCVRLVILGGEAVRPDAVTQWRRLVCDDVELLNTYGPTEATIVSAWYTIEGEVGDDIPIGAPVPGAILRVLDDQGRRVPVGVRGELCIGGAGLASGYRGDDDATARAFIDHDGERLYRTGDRAAWRPDGLLAFHGRVDGQVKIRGQRVETAEVERVLATRDDVEAAVVAARPGPTGPVLRAWVATAAAGTSSEALRGWLSERLPDAMVPVSIELVDEFPTTRHGKIDVVALPDPVLAGDDGACSDADAGADEPSDLELALVDAFEETFGVTGLDRHADFFALGGDSLTAVRLMTRLEGSGVRPPFRALLEAATPAGIAAAMESGAAGGGVLPADHWLVRAATLDDDITPVHPAPAEGRPSWCALLTGATGFLGAYLVKEILERTDAEVIALVRARDTAEAEARLRAHLEEHDVWGVKAEGRVRVVVGDLARPRLGLSEDDWRTVSEDVDTIWHSGAIADFVRPYEHLEDANVGGTREVLRLAVTERTKVVHHVSTIGIFDTLDPAAHPTPTEDADLLAFADVIGGYAQTKWVAERLVREAMARGLPATIHRPGRLVAAASTGVINEDDMTARLLAACLQVACVPDVDGPTDATPVDFAAAAIVALATAADGRGKTSHVMNPTPVRLADLVAWLRERRPEMRLVGVNGWRDALLAAAGEREVAALAPLLAAAGFAADEAGSSADDQLPSVSCDRSRSRWEAAGLTCPEIGPEFVGRVLEILDPRQPA